MVAGRVAGCPCGKSYFVLDNDNYIGYTSYNASERFGARGSRRDEHELSIYRSASRRRVSNAKGAGRGLPLICGLERLVNGWTVPGEPLERLFRQPRPDADVECLLAKVHLVNGAG